MPIISYLAYPSPGKGETLAQRLDATPHCEVIPSDQHQMLLQQGMLLV